MHGSNGAADVVLGRPDGLGGITSGIPYRDVPGMLRGRMSFVGRSISGAYGYHNVYVVRSYSTPIAAVYSDGRVDIIGENLWGPVTGRHINLCRAWL